VAGRKVRGMLSSLLVYLVTVIKTPKKFLKEFDKLRRPLGWGWTAHRWKVQSAWIKVCTPTPNGVNDLECFSRAL